MTNLLFHHFITFSFLLHSSGYVSEHTAYHHGEASLHSTIVKMAQDFMGANNIPLLFPSGQFGTRSGVSVLVI